MKKLIIVPTYNELENIVPLVREVFAKNLGFDILVVDDNSPDGTALAVMELQKEFSGLYILQRPGKQGLGKAYLAGFEWGLNNNYEWLVEMDADFSHRPEDLRVMVQAMDTNDFIIGSRYIPGGGTVNWGILRKLISRAGGIYSRMILGYPIQDWTGGFNAWRKKVLLGIGLSEIQSNGYSFQIELKYKASKKNFKGVEVPILFEDRRVGQSKMSGRIVLEALYKVWSIRSSTR